MAARPAGGAVGSGEGESMTPFRHLQRTCVGVAFVGLTVATAAGCGDSDKSPAVTPDASAADAHDLSDVAAGDVAAPEAAAADLAAGDSAADSGGGDASDPAVEALLALGAGKDKPIMDTHIHLFQVDRPGGAPWPTPDNMYLFKNSLPADYEALAKPLGIVASGIVEASPLQADTQWVLDKVAGNPFFPFYVAQLEIGSADFVKNLDDISKDKRVVGIRGYLWSPMAGITLDGKQLADLKELSKRGMTLDLISRYTLNPKAKVIELAKAVPDLRIIIDHLAGAKSATVEPQWKKDIELLAQNKNVYIKFSSLFDMFNPSPTGDESKPWTPTKNVADYKAHLDVLLDAFGPDRLIFGSNHPVVALGGTLKEEIDLAEAYLAPRGKEVRDKVMFRNAIYFYRRLPPK
jgi:predicted TIM-barrel fold metal-dependent hydrolase